MKKLLAAASFAVLLPFAAEAQESDAERAAALEQCLLDASGPEQEAMIRNLLIALLEEDIEQIEALVVAFYNELGALAIAECDAPDDIATQQWAADVPGNYMEVMVTEIFTAALMRLGG